jgi:integrase
MGNKIPMGQKREHRYLPPEEIGRVAHEIANPPRHRSRPFDVERIDLALMVRVAVGTGLRQGELSY